MAPSSAGAGIDDEHDGTPSAADASSNWHGGPRPILISTAGAPPIPTQAGTFEPHPVAGDAIDKLLLGLQERLGALETEVAARNDDPEALVVLDGPISRGRYRIPHALGYVKSHRTGYLPSNLADVVSRLAPRERTPIFLTQTTWSRYSWYVRLPGGEGHPWSGVVRCEVLADGDVERCRTLADQTTALLPDYASEPHKETRAPQNLYPISMLERELRRYLGDAYYVSREIKASARRLGDTA